MRLLWVAALVLGTALLFGCIGIAFGYWIIPESKGDSAECLVIRHRLLADEGFPADVLDYYNENCR